MDVTIKVDRNAKIHAIKLVRALTGDGLRESKDLVESVLPFGSSSPNTAKLTVETFMPWDECQMRRLVAELTL